MFSEGNHLIFEIEAPVCILVLVLLVSNIFLVVSFVGSWMLAYHRIKLKLSLYSSQQIILNYNMKTQVCKQSLSIERYK